MSSKLALITRKTARELLPARRPEGHKHTFGQVLIIGGSQRLPGAAVLASEAVLSAGAGTVTLAAPESAFKNSAVLPEVMILPLSDSKQGTFNASSYRQVGKEDLSKFDAFAVGPGMLDTAETRSFFGSLIPKLMEFEKPIVLDADALNCLSHKLIKLNDNVILTPHVGEARKLLQSDKDTTLADMAGALRSKYNAQIVLKSAETFVAGGDGKVWVNTTGNNGLATAGSGDVLTGIVASLLAQGCVPLDAARLGVYLHGLAGDLAGKEYTEYGLRAGLVSDFLAPALRSLS